MIFRAPQGLTLTKDFGELPRCSCAPSLRAAPRRGSRRTGWPPGEQWVSSGRTSRSRRLCTTSRRSPMERGNGRWRMAGVPFPMAISPSRACQHPETTACTRSQHDEDLGSSARRNAEGAVEQVLVEVSSSTTSIRMKKAPSARMKRKAMIGQRSPVGSPPGSRRSRAGDDLDADQFPSAGRRSRGLPGSRVDQ